MSDNFELLACLKMAAGLPCDPRHRKTLLQAADEIDKLQTQLTAARDEVEKLRGRVAELECGASDVVELFDRVTGEIDYDVYELFQRAIEKLRDMPKSNRAWLLRKQAEAIEKVALRFPESPFVDCDNVRADIMGDAEILRRQADEAERAGGGDA